MFPYCPDHQYVQKQKKIQDYFEIEICSSPHDEQTSPSKYIQ